MVADHSINDENLAAAAATAHHGATAAACNVDGGGFVGVTPQTGRGNMEAMSGPDVVPYALHTPVQQLPSELETLLFDDSSPQAAVGTGQSSASVIASVNVRSLPLLVMM